MFITVHLTPAAAASLRQNDAEGANLRKTLGDQGVQLQPLHPDAASADLACAFYVTASSSTDANQLLQTLRNHPAVEGAYVKPLDEPPS